MLKIGDKTFLNLQEAVAWLMENNCIPFQCTAPYAANTEIGMGTIVNPSPAKVRIGSIIFFSDSKVSTVTGVTDNGFIVSDKYNNLVDDVSYITDVKLNASGHIICTLSDGTTIDGGLVKMINGLAINASQHLIASYNDGTSNDLGPIFSGNVNVSGDLTATHAKIFETIEDSNGHKRFIEGVPTEYLPTGMTLTYKRWSLCGSHLMVVLAGTIAANTTIYWEGPLAICGDIPQWILDKIIPTVSDFVELKVVKAFNSSLTTQDLTFYIKKTTQLFISMNHVNIDDDRMFRVAFDLLIDNQ